MTKNELMARLTELKIDFDPRALKADLLALLPAGEQQTEEDAEAVAEEADTSAPSVANVHQVGGVFVRAYSLAVHGDGFQTLAHEFADPRGLEVRMGTVSNEPVAAAPVAEVGVTAEVRSSDGQLVRAYTKEIHGDGFESLAHEFADPRSFTVVVV